MRKLLIKLLVGDYLHYMGNRKYMNYVRASTILFPLILINGLLTIVNDDPLFSNWIKIIFFALFIFFALYTFVWLRIKPAKWEELDFNQKWQRGMKGILQNPDHRREFQQMSFPKSDPIWILWINIVFFVVCVGFAIISVL